MVRNLPISPRIIGLGLLGLLLAGAGWLAFASGSAEAHGVQVASDPAPNAQLDEPPELITVTFSEPIEPSVSTIQLFDASAQEVPLGAHELFDDPKVLGVRVPGELESSLYTVVWRNLSTIDGHIWSGSFPFTVLGPGGEVPTGTAAPVEIAGFAGAPFDSPSSLQSAARWVVLLGGAAMLGGAAYVLFVVSPASGTLGRETNASLRSLSRTVLLATAAIGAFLALQGSVLQLVVQANDLGGLGRFDELLTDTRLGHYLLARQGLLVVALGAMALVWRARGARAELLGLALLLVVSFGVLVTQSLVSHAAAADGSFWTTAVDLLHLTAASLWVGGLIHVGLAMPRWLDELKGVPRTLFAVESFRRFSVLAAVSVVVLLTSGVLSALVQFTSWDELWSTSYGWSLVGKLAVMLPLLGVAGLNAFVLRPRVSEAGLRVAGGAGADAGPSHPAEEAARLQRLLASTVRAEAVLGIAVLVAVAVLIQLQSPRTTADAAEQAAALAGQPATGAIDRGFIQADAEVEGLIMVLRIEPGQLGQNSFELGLGSEFGAIGEVLEARLEFDHESAGEGGSRLPLDLTGSARYTAGGSNLSLPGAWTITANIRRRGEDDVRGSFQVEIPEAAAPEPAAEAEESDTIWQWPFHGARSAAAIALLAGVGVGVGGWAALRIASRR